MHSSQLSKWNFRIKIGVLTTLLIVSIPPCALWGSANVSYGETMRVLLSKFFPFYYTETRQWVQNVIWELRMPRILLGIAVGGGLSVCGVAMQALTRNVLAEPYILGVSSGASAFAVFVLMFGGGGYLFSLGVLGAAFLGALCSLVLGALFLIWADVGARVVLAPSEISIGIVTAFCGGPFFIYLLRKRKKAA